MEVCAHCGDSCDVVVRNDQNLSFCCQGCSQVYDVIRMSGLENYYKLNKSPGIKAEAKAGGSEYEVLDDPDVVARLSDFHEGSRLRVRFYFPQIHCSSCIWLLENIYKLSPGILQSRIRFMERTGDFIIDTDQITLRGLAELLHSLGYGPELKLDRLSQKRTPSVSKSLYYQLGVAGFCFGNIMLLSFPEYLGLEDPLFRSWISGLNIALGFATGFLFWKVIPPVCLQWNQTRQSEH